MKKRLIVIGLAAALSASVCGVMTANAEVLYLPTANYSQRAAERGIPSSVRVETTDSEDFYRYNNYRFNLHTWVPVFLDQVRPPVNGDGCLFKNEDGTVALAVSGGHQYPRYTIDDYYDREIDSSITYKTRGENWYVVSGVKNGNVYYSKSFVGDNVVASLYFSYPYSEKDDYDWIVPILDEHFTSEDWAVF